MREVKHAAALHDLSGYGRCSMTIVLPVLSTMGVSVSPALTAYLSAHTGFPPSSNAMRQDMSAALEGTLTHWKELDVRFDAVYTGYFAGETQLAAAQRLMDDQPDALVLVDPVLGDHGAAYRGITPEHCAAMGRLMARADIITPNLTECALLLGEPYQPDPDEAQLRRYLTALSGGSRSVVITGVRGPVNRIGAALLDRRGDSMHLFLRPEVPGQFAGTGDLFASVLLGGILRGDTLPVSVERAVTFTASCVAHSVRAEVSPREGVLFQPLLGQLV